MSISVSTPLQISRNGIKYLEQRKKMVLYSSQKILQMHSTRKNEKVLVKMVI